MQVKTLEGMHGSGSEFGRPHGTRDSVTATNVLKQAGVRPDPTVRVAHGKWPGKFFWMLQLTDSLSHTMPAAWSSWRVPTGVAAEEMMAEPISITVGGNSYWGIAVVDNDLDGTDADNPETDDIAISNDVELKFSGSTVLDSGVEVGVRIEIEGEESDDQGDETYMYVEGSFGTIRVGNDDAASAQMGATAPYATFFYGINTPFWTAGISSAGSISTLAGADVGSGGDGDGDGDSASMMYFSPVFNGFQFGVSYAPEAGAEARSGTADRSKDGDAYSVGLRYDGNFGDAGVTISAGYTSQNVRKVDDYPTYLDNGVTRRVITRDFANDDMHRYLTNDEDDPVSGAENLDDIQVYQRSQWHKPRLEQFVDATPSEGKTAQQVFEEAVKRYETAIDKKHTLFKADYNADGDTNDVGETVYQYQQIPALTPGQTDYKPAAPVAGRTVSDYSAGVVVSMSGVSVGGSYRSIDHDIKNADDTVHWDVGVSYGEGPWVVSANYGAKTQDDDGEGNKTDNGYARLMANYNLGPGIDLAGVIGQDTTDGGEDTSFAGIAMGISF